MAKKQKTEQADGRVVLAPAIEGLIVRDPYNFEILPFNGAKKVLNSFWNKRIKSGEVIIKTDTDSGAKKDGE